MQRLDNLVKILRRIENRKGLDNTQDGHVTLPLAEHSWKRELLRLMPGNDNESQGGADYWLVQGIDDQASGELGIKISRFGWHPVFSTGNSANHLRLGRI